MNRSVEIVGLFPSLESSSIGGVQASGRQAWSGIVARTGVQHAKALCYERPGSKAKAVLAAIVTGRTAGTILVWHLHLLKLVPFLRHSRSRVILFLHGIEAWVEHSGITRLLLKHVDLFLTNSEHTWSRFVEANATFRGAPHITVPLGLGSRSTTPTPVAPTVPAALMIGRLDKREDYKGHRQMIQAWPLLLERIHDAKLWIIGDGNFRPELERLAARPGLKGSIRFLGQVPDVQKQQLIAQSRCLAVPSKGEGFGLVYLEAMRLGRPCLVSDVDAGREVVNPPEAGLAVNPDDPRQTADALHHLLTPGPEWDTWSDHARARYESRFTSHHFSQRLIDALFES